MSKTAVEWLIDQMKQRENQGMSLSMYELEMFGEKAKEMEKEQIIDAFDDGAEEWCDGFYKVDISSEHYYNETFKSK